MQGQALLKALLIRRDRLLNPKPVIGGDLATFEELKHSSGGKGRGVL